MKPLQIESGRSWAEIAGDIATLRVDDPAGSVSVACESGEGGVCLTIHAGERQLLRKTTAELETMTELQQAVINLAGSAEFMSLIDGAGRVLQTSPDFSALRHFLEQAR